LCTVAYTTFVARDDDPYRDLDIELDPGGDELEDDDDPNDPSHRDHDLSETAPDWWREAPRRPLFARRWALLIVALIAVAGLVLPYLRIIF
jgi:hypothetical protein